LIFITCEVHLASQVTLKTWIKKLIKDHFKHIISYKKETSLWNNIKIENLLYFVIDTKDKLFSLIPPEVLNQARKNILTIIQMFGDLKIPIIGTAHYVKRLGYTNQDILKIWKRDSFTNKLTFSLLNIMGELG